MTTTTSRPRHPAHPIDPATLAQLRAADDAGHACEAYTDEEGGAPLRCCLRRSRPGESVALVSYAPLRRWAAERWARPGAYDEQGPVFIHAEDCGGPVAGAAGYPFARPGALRVLRRYDADGRIAGGRFMEIPQEPTPALDEALDEAFADPAVALVQLRAAEHGCLLFTIHRPHP
ncbi:DUF1203 domain-containing protein [Streptomyces uncialis]|uniref:DUF1203 domain-containing protein n=1 Tax=Streptomyces uncialis TaxID=1048205 RepID=A0A1Q4UZX1_9ACTN|nr:DUF1203 domain-containing protein [Streptomyces uncialis]OKH91066.1 hypothetical protein AB852_31800 [Streptomyces uncialis]